VPKLDIFNDDAFSLASLTASINTQPEGQAAPSELDALFDEEGITTTVVSIERENDSLILVPASERGAPGDVTLRPARDEIPFKTLHLPTRGAIKADEVQGVRAFGSETELQTVEAIVAGRLRKMRSRIEATIRYHRVGAITGKIYDADGQKVLLDLYARFGITQQTVAFTLAAEGTDVAQKIRDAKRKSEDVIAGTGVITGWLGICGRGFYDAFVGHATVKTAFDRWNDGQFLRDDLRKGFTYQDVVWKEYYGKVGNIDFIGTDDAYLIPIGIDDLFITRFAPADFMETVNTIGLPFYAAQEMMKMNKGVDLEAQSNPLNICTRPRAVIKLKKGA
jgi:hypothetical protein